ncbi:CU044_5270 family protein [Streptomyces sp. RPT161]|uniref:CU044_5270 family protein n=1 Tax=Streptomyces sp. RPT161 TaxID=3015993 RepID=UPI0022B85920|nr:CU044_5270 family protein [Streptomyces sp. RPT161]
MNASPSQPHPAEWQETEGLLPTVERELPAGRHQFHKERLMAQIHDDLDNSGSHPARTRAAKPRNPFLRRAIVLPVAACALTGAIVTGVRMFGTSGSVTGLATGPVLTTRIGTADVHGVSQLLDRISLAAQENPGPQASAGQYIYIETKTASTHVRTVDDKSSVVSDALHTRQTWQSPDGHKGWLIEPGNTDSTGTSLDSKVEPYLNAPSYDYLATLPTDPDALLKKIYTETKGHGPSPDAEAFTTIGDLLSQSYPPGRLSAALYRAAAKIPGVVKVDDAVDAAGRHGVAVARLDEASGQRTEWIFDKETFTFLGERTVQVKGTSGDHGLIKPGMIVDTEAVTERAIVNGMKQTPSHTG